MGLGFRLFSADTLNWDYLHRLKPCHPHRTGVCVRPLAGFRGGGHYFQTIWLRCPTTRPVLNYVAGIESTGAGVSGRRNPDRKPFAYRAVFGNDSANGSFSPQLAQQADCDLLLISTTFL